MGWRFRTHGGPSGHGRCFHSFKFGLIFEGSSRAHFGHSSFPFLSYGEGTVPYPYRHAVECFLSLDLSGLFSGVDAF